MNKAEFFTSHRDEKIALWVRVNDINYNIWDLTVEEATPAVLKAIRSAYERGYMTTSVDVAKTVRLGRQSIGVEWGIKE